jgi:hypothetical protein
MRKEMVMVQAGWFLNNPWWWLMLYLPALAFTIPFGAGQKEHRS